MLYDTLQIDTKSKNYPIYFTNDFTHLCDAIIALEKKYSMIVVLTDTNVDELYCDMVFSALTPLNIPLHSIIFEAGEVSKTLDTIQSCYRSLLEHQADRNTLIIGLGGGVTGDMAGFLAATYMRGVDFVQIPTSLLAQVDSSVGGKTGVDVDGYKNVVGAFYQPMFVYINIKTLKTLPKREYIAGLSEVIKHGIICDKNYFAYIEDHIEDIKESKEEVMVEIVRGSCKIKKSIIDIDEKEHGIRAYLNFGHTYGHSIEKVKNFQLVHGECVFLGMIAALELSKHITNVSEEEITRMIDLFKAFDATLYIDSLDKDKVYKEMFSDKKSVQKMIRFVVIDKIGSCTLTDKMIDPKIIYRGMDAIIKN